MKKDLNWARIAAIGVGIIWVIATLLPDYTRLFNF